MSLRVRLFPGFPLPVTDYATMLEHLAGDNGQHRDVIVAHSLGALEALSQEGAPGVPVFLLAPSTPDRRRPARPVVRAALHLLGRSPGAGAALARRLRASTYRRYGGQTPAGKPLSLHEAADRLRRTAPQSPPSLSALCFVLYSPQDPRHLKQLELAERIDAAAHRVEGGHLFPITQGHRTAEAILELLRDLGHRHENA